MNEWEPAPDPGKVAIASIGVQRVTTKFCLLQNISSCVIMSHFPPTCPESLLRQPLLTVRQQRCFPQPWTKCTFLIWEEMEMMGQPFQWVHRCPFDSFRKCIDFLLSISLPSLPLSFNSSHCLYVCLLHHWVNNMISAVHSFIFIF